MKRITFFWFWALFSAASVAAPGSSCDCQQMVGACSASISVKPGESAKGSYSAELKITSSAPYCSKVDYYVDGTPYFNILANTNTETDSVWGQKPITRAAISEVSCKICTRLDDRQPGNTFSAPNSGALLTTFSGEWKSAACPAAAGWWGSGGENIDQVYKLHQEGQRLSGTIQMQNYGGANGQMDGSSTGSKALVKSSLGSTHQMTVSSDGQSMTDQWCNKDGGCSTCNLSRVR